MSETKHDIHRFLLIQSHRLCINILSDAYSRAAYAGSAAAATRRRRRRPRARRGRRRHRLHRPGAAAAAVAPSGGHADGGDVVGRRPAPARRLPALARIWDGTIVPLSTRARSPRRRRRVPGAAGCGGRRAGADARRRRRPRHRPLRRVPAARRGGAGALVSGNAPAAGGARLRPDRARARRRRAARRWWPTRAATRPPRCWRWRRWSRPACCCRTPTSSSTPSRACRAPARRRRSARTSPKCTAAWRPTACSATATAPKSSRALGRDGHVHAAPGAARSRHPGDDLRARARPAPPKRRSATSSSRPTRGATVRPAGRLGAARNQARRAHQLLRHRLARRPVGPRGPGVGHRQPAEGRVGPGRAEHERDARPRRADRAAVSSRWSSSSAANCSRIARTARHGRRPVSRDRRGGTPLVDRPRRRQGNRRGAEDRRHREAAGRRAAHHRRADARRRRLGAGRRGQHAVRRGAEHRRRRRGRADRRRRRVRAVGQRAAAPDGGRPRRRSRTRRHAGCRRRHAGAARR